jgi:mannose-6-phosphate isomerase-like protein (cupin superfamily)
MYPDSGTYTSAISQLSARFRIILNGNQTSNLLTVVDDFIYNGAASRHQIHTREDVTFLVLNGTLQVYLDGYQFCAPAGTTFYVPRNTEQSQHNFGSKPAHVQIIFTPSGMENFLYQMIPLFSQPTVNQTAATQIAQNYGITFFPEVTWENLHCVQ